MKSIKPVCLACGSTEFRTKDRILATSDISEFRVDDAGKLDVEYCGEAEVDWNSQAAVDPEHPFECSKCLYPCNAADLIGSQKG